MEFNNIFYRWITNTKTTIQYFEANGQIRGLLVSQYTVTEACYFKNLTNTVEKTFRGFFHTRRAKRWLLECIQHQHQIDTRRKK